MVIKGISSNITEMGKLLKMSKRCFTWVFLIDGVQHTVEIVVSHITRKKQVLHNGEVVHDATQHKDKTYLGQFQFMFQIEMNVVTITQKGETFYLRINNIPFEELCEDYQHQANPQGPQQDSNYQNQNTMYSQPQPQSQPHYQYQPEPQPQPQPTLTLGQRYQDHLGDLSGLRGERTDKTAKPNQEVSPQDNYYKNHNTGYSQPQTTYNHVQEQPQPASTLGQKYHSQLGDFSSLRGVRSSNPRATVEEDFDYRKINPKVRGSYNNGYDQQSGSHHVNNGGNINSKENYPYNEEISSPPVHNNKEELNLKQHNEKEKNPLLRIKNSVQGYISKIHWPTH